MFGGHMQDSGRKVGSGSKFISLYSTRPMSQYILKCQLPSIHSVLVRRHRWWSHPPIFAFATYFHTQMGLFPTEYTTMLNKWSASGAGKDGRSKVDLGWDYNIITWGRTTPTHQMDIVINLLNSSPSYVLYFVSPCPLTSLTCSL